MKEDNMMYLIIKEITFKNVDSVFDVINFTNDIDKANDMLQGYNLINKENNVIYTLVKYEQPLILTKEMEC
tara:strand:- start:74 stop:286 length:213 start_codon:yes stop_codon:yes gene_type:complete